MPLNRPLFPLLPAVVSVALLAATPAQALLFTVTNTATGGAGSLHAAITQANSSVAHDIIQFNIPGAGVHTIGGVLPPITESLEINGYSQSGSSVNTKSDDTTDAVIRIELDGSALGQGEAVLDVQGGPLTVRGVAIRGIPAEGAGVNVDPGATGTQTIKGCFIGTDASGSVADSAGSGLVVGGTALVGSSTAGDRNLFSGNAGAGIELRGPSSTVSNNLIGSTADGAGSLPNGDGVRISSSSATGNVVGGSSNPFGNVIRGNNDNGVQVNPDAGDNRIERNTIYDNGALAIDLGNDGVTDNDPGDVDSGPNRLQNYPVLTFARVNGTTLSIEGNLDAEPGMYRMAVFASTDADESGFGEGESFLQSLTLTVNEGSSPAFFRAGVALAEEPSESFFVTATATSVEHDATSEFSRAIETVDGGTVLTVGNANTSGGGSLAAILDQANANPDINTIVFQMPVPLMTIEPAAGYVLSTPVIIDGYTQKQGTIATPNTSETGSNAVLGVSIDGSNVPADTPGFLVTSPGCIIRGLAIYDFDGSGVEGDGADGLRVEGNFIGTDAGGTSARGNGEAGVATGNSEGVVVGGPILAQRNLLSANTGPGVDDSGQASWILGNAIGLDADGDDLGNGQAGVACSGTDALVGDDWGAGNRIWDNAGAGVRVSGGDGNTIAGNDIGQNTGLGIDLDTAGVTANDANDTDGGANDRQNFPVLATATVGPGNLQVSGSLDVPSGASDDTYTIRVFENEACDPSGNGQGERFLGAADVELSGNAENFVINVAADLEAGGVVTATATEVDSGNTSEFSACRTTSLNEECGDGTEDGQITAADGLFTLRAAVGSVSCDLCRCDVNGNGGLSASDALAVLKAAVGQSVPLVCPACA